MITPTHAGLVSGIGRQFESECPGAVDRVHQGPEFVLPDGTPEGRTVSVWYCQKCGLYISTADGFSVLDVHTFDPSPRGGRSVLNVYQGPRRPGGAA